MIHFQQTLTKLKRRLHSKLEFLFYRDVTDWPELKALRKSIPDLVCKHLDALMAGEKSRATLKFRATQRAARVRADVIYLGTIKADALKDIIALRKDRPGLVVGALSITPLEPGHFAFKHFDTVIELRSLSHLVRELLSAEAPCLVMQGGDDQPMLLAACLWPGRLVWQVRDTNLRKPRQYIDDLVYRRAAVLAERADAICTFHIRESFESLRGELDIKGSIHMVRPMCVSAIGPQRFLPKLSKKTSEHHVVYAAGIDKLGGSEFAPGLQTRSADQYEKFRAIIEQGIHVHVYSPHLKVPRKGWEPYFELAEKSKYFHIEKTLDYFELMTVLTQYDVAFSHFDFQEFMLRPPFRYYVSNGYYTFVQARLPIITSPSEPQRTEYLTAFANGFEINGTDFTTSFRSKLEECLHKTTPELLDKCARALEYDYAGFQSAVFGTVEAGSREPATLNSGKRRG